MVYDVCTKDIFSGWERKLASSTSKDRAKKRLNKICSDLVKEHSGSKILKYDDEFQHDVKIVKLSDGYEFKFWIQQAYFERRLVSLKKNGNTYIADIYDQWRQEYEREEYIYKSKKEVISILRDNDVIVGAKFA